jgi:hypothetical protein
MNLEDIAVVLNNVDGKSAMKFDVASRSGQRSKLPAPLILQRLQWNPTSRWRI